MTWMEFLTFCLVIIGVISLVKSQFSLHTHLPHFLLLYICVSRDETNRYMADSEIQNRAMPAAGFFT